MKLSLLIIVLTLFAAAAVAQENGALETPVDGQATAPATLLGQGPRLAPLGESAGPNYVTGGITISQMYTDNAELTSDGQISDLSYDFEPNIAISHSTPRLSYDLGVLAGFVVNQKLDNRNQASQSAAFDLSYGLAQFVTLRLSDRFTNGMGLWQGTDSAGSGSGGAGIGVVQQANNSLFTYGQFRTNIALAELSGQLNATSFAGLRGTQSYTSFPSGATDPVSGTLYGGNSYSAEAFYNHQFTLRNWGGITLRAQRFDLNDAVGRTDTASVLFLYAISIRPTTSLSFFGGPELSVTAVPLGTSLVVTPFPRRLWSPAAGVEFSGQSRSLSASASFAHQVNNSGGLISAVTLNSVDAAVLRQIGRRLRVGPGFGYAQSVPIVTSPTIRTYTGRLQMNYHIANCSLDAGYARDNRTDLSGGASASANRIWIGFSYGFLKPLGR